MAKRWDKVVRVVCTVAASGLLMQAGSCALDPTQTAQTLTAAVVGNLVGSIVFNLFGVPFGQGF